MRVVSRFSPARGRLESSVLSRLILCLVLLYGCTHAASEETKSEIGVTGSTGRVAERVEGIGRTVDGEAAVDVVDCDVTGEGKCGESGQPVTGVGKSANLVDDGAGDAVDGAAGLVANVGECSGRRFKKLPIAQSGVGAGAISHRLSSAALNR